MTNAPLAVVDTRLPGSVRLDDFRDLLAAAAAGGDLDETLSQLNRWVERVIPGALCSVLLLHPDGRRVHVAAASSLPPDFSAAIEGLEIGPTAGSCGTAMWRRAPVLVTDIATDPLWEPYRGVALPFGLRSCWSHPILGHDRGVLGSFAVYRCEPGPPGPGEDALMADVASLAGLVVERARSDADRRRREAELRDAQEIAKLGHWRYDVATRTTEWSLETFRILGYEPGRDVPSFDAALAHVAPEERAFLMEGARRIVREAIPYAYDHRLVLPDGTVRYAHVRATAVRGPDGAVAAVAGSLMDVTDRKRIEQALRESEARYRALIEYGADVVTVLDEQGTILYASPSVQRVLGFDPDELIGHPAIEFVHPEDREFMLARLAERLRGVDAEEPATYRFRSRSGAWRVVESASRLRRDERAGRFLVLNSRDITPQREAENALASSERLFKAIANESPELIFLFDIIDEKNVFVNRAVERCFGYAANELVHRPDVLALTVHTDDLALVRAHIARIRALADGAVEEAVYRVNAPDGVRWVHVKVVVFSRDPDGRVRLVLSLGSDITDRRVLESRVRQSEKMESLGTLAGGIAHDFNNLLAAILGYGELVHASLPPRSEAAGDMQQVIGAARRARDLVRQILAFSRQQDLERVPVDAGSVVEETLRLVRASLPSTIAIRTRLAPTLSAVVGDASQVQQVLLNLCTNAEYAMRGRPGAALEVTTSEVALDSVAAGAAGVVPGCYVRITVSDTGAGIPAEQLPRIFEPFFTTKPVGEGTGLGLAVAHGIVSSHGGAIRARSAPGQGTTFEVDLPCAPASAAIPAIEAPPLQPGTGRILIVDDEVALVNVIKRILLRLGYSPIVAHDAEQALDLFDQAPDAVDLVITDLTMPDMTGDVLARELLARRPDLPIVLVTGFSPHMTPERARELGIAAYLTKPMEIVELAATLQRLLPRR